MGLGYAQKLLEFFYEDPDGTRASLARRVRDVTRGISRETAAFLTRAIEMVEGVDLNDVDRIERETALLGLEIAEADAHWQSVLDELLGDMETFAARSRRARSSLRVPRELLRAARRLAIGATLAASAACSRERPTMMPADPVPPPTMPDGAPRQIMMPADPVPMPMDPVPMPMDPVPRPMRGPVIMPADPAPMPPMVVDPPPPPGGSYHPPVTRDAGTRPSRVRRPGPQIMAPDPLPRQLPNQPFEKTGAQRLRVLVDQWRDTTPRAVERTDDLPLSSPPDVTLEAVREGDAVRLTLRGAPSSIGTRWRSRGVIEGDGNEVLWRPSSRDDALRVAVRTTGGVAIVSLRAVEIR